MAKMTIPPNGPAQLRRIRAEALQLVEDVKWYNLHRPDAVPFDIGADLMVVRLCDQGLAAAERGDGEAYARIAAELVGAAERAVAVSDEEA